MHQTHTLKWNQEVNNLGIALVSCQQTTAERSPTEPRKYEKIDDEVAVLRCYHVKSVLLLQGSHPGILYDAGDVSFPPDFHHGVWEYDY